jgi:hypothetical protein
MFDFRQANSVFGIFLHGQGRGKLHAGEPSRGSHGVWCGTLRLEPGTPGFRHWKNLAFQFEVHLSGRFLFPFLRIFGSFEGSERVFRSQLECKVN